MPKKVITPVYKKIFNLLIHLPFNRILKKPILLSIRYYKSQLKLVLRDYKAYLIDHAILSHKSYAMNKNNIHNESDLEVSEIKSIAANGKDYFYDTNYDLKKIKISFACSMRHLGNTDSNPDKFFKSLIEETKNLDAVEVLIAIDSDDDIRFFINLINLYKDKIHSKLIVVNKKFGYNGLHLYDKILYKNISPYTKMICDFSDDCRIVKKSWDIDLLKIDRKYEDNIYIIHSSKSKYRKTNIDYTKISIDFFIYLYSVVGPASYFPIFSKKILDIANESLLKIEDKKIADNWSPVANNFMVDCCIDMIGNYIRLISEIDRVEYVNFLQINIQDTEDQKVSFKLDSRDKGFSVLSHRDTLNHFKTIAEDIILNINQR